jgi:dihydrofolate synthase/folylpolyglutamate synthase
VGDVGPEAWAVIERVAAERGAALISARRGVDVAPLPPEAGSDNVFSLRTPVREYGTVKLSLRGAHQAANALVAIRLLETLDTHGLRIPPAAMIFGLEHVSWPGRLERRMLSGGRELILDAAHNPAGAAALSSYLRGSGGTPPVLVFAVMRDKDIGGMLRTLLPAVSRLIVTRAANSRSADPDVLAAEAHTIVPGLAIDVIASPVAALDAAWTMSSRVVVAGSIFLLGDIMKEIGA